MKRVPMMLAVALLAFGVGQAQALPIVIDFQGGYGGTITKNLNLYTGVGIRISTLQLINTPLHAGAFATDAVLSFGYGGEKNYVNVVGGVPAAGIASGSLLLRGEFTTFEVFPTCFGIAVLGAGPDVKSPLLLEFAGLPANTSFELYGFNMSAGSRLPGVYSAFATDISNTAVPPVPDPGSTLLLLGVSATGLVAARRRWR